MHCNCWRYSCNLCILLNAVLLIFHLFSLCVPVHKRNNYLPRKSSGKRPRKVTRQIDLKPHRPIVINSIVANSFDLFTHAHIVLEHCIFFGLCITRMAASIVSDRFVEDKTQLHFGHIVSASRAKWLGGCLWVDLSYLLRNVSLAQKRQC